VKRLRVTRSPSAGVALLVAVALGFTIVKYPAVFTSLDDRAATNSHAPDRQLAGAVSIDISRSFLLAARRLLPERARYTVSVGPNVQVSNSVVLGAVSPYAEFWLLPRELRVLRRAAPATPATPA
jgi:hypothetical protein